MCNFCRVLFNGGELKLKEADDPVFISNGDQGVFATIGNLEIQDER